MVRISLFGGVSAATDGGEPLDVGAMRSQAVLAALALSPGSAVPVPRLIELVWGDAPPQTAEKALQWHIAQLRRGLGAGAIVRTGAAYRLDIESDAIDVARFQRHLRAGDIEAALAEWAGAPLAGIEAPGLTATVDGLVEQWLSAIEVDLRRRVETDAQATIGPLTELSARHPFREGLWALLMTALYRVGRQADALAAFRRARQVLLEQLGVDPGPRLRELESLILDHDESLRGDARGGEVHPEPVPTEGSGHGTLPDRPGRLVGREADLDAVKEALARSPVVTLVGPGGIGKTRLAVAAAMAATDRGLTTWLIELAEITSPDDVALAVADALGVTQRVGGTLTQSVVTFLRRRSALLVIDNCEHVIAGAAEVVQAIAEGCPQLRLLTTSRERLGVDGEQVVVVGPLELAAGVELFHARALAVDQSFDPHADRQDVEEICRRLDGIPLAIELAAARTRAFRPPDLVARLADGLSATGARRAGATRHRTLAATIQWSYDLLTSAEQALFERLSVFNGPFDIAAAEAVAADGALTRHGVDEALESLVERSMLTVAFRRSGRRFRMLETMRQFAAECLLRRGQTGVVAERHARWCVRQVADISHLLRGTGEGEGVKRLGELWPNLRAGVGWARAAGDPALVDALVRPIATEIALRAAQEIGDWAEDILALTSPDDEDLRAFWLLWVAERYVQNGDTAGYERVVRRYGEPDRALSRYARSYSSGDGGALWDCLPQAVAELRGQGEDYLAVFLEMTSAGTLLGIGRFAEVDASVSALADRFRAQGPPTLLHWALQTLAYSASFQGRNNEAELYFDEAASIDLPEGALSANKVVEARSAFRRGLRSRAYEILRSYIDEQFDTDNMAVASVICVEFINMMAAADRHAEAAHMLSYLAVANDFGALASRTLVADAAAKISIHTADVSGAPTPRIDDRQALTYMREVLDHLAG